jgi:phage I-like protein
MKLRPISPLLALSLTAAEGAPQEPPKEIRLFAKGINKSTKGDILFDDEAAKSVMEQWKERGSKRLPFDFQHKRLDDRAPVDETKAAGWFTPEIRDGDLWATNIEWTPKVFQEIQHGEWGYYSPAGYCDKQTGRFVRLVNCAITNLPSLTDIGVLTASDRRIQLVEGMSFADVREAISRALAATFPLRDLWIQDIFDDYVIVEACCGT